MKILILAPHADDETLGAGGLMARRALEGHEVDVVVAVIGEVRRGSEVKSTIQARRLELAEATRLLGVRQTTVLFEGPENQLDSLPQLSLVSKLDAILSDGQYDQVFLPYPSHHQDHEAVFRAGFGALREKGSGGPSLIAMWEYPYVGWNYEPVRGGRYYVDVSDTLPMKLEALAVYRSQSYAAPHPIAPESVEALARWRGVECGRRYAELFYVLKMVDVG